MSKDQTKPSSLNDATLPFQLVGCDVRGRTVRLEESINEILKSHDYPLLVARQLGEVIALAALLASSLKLQGKLTLQTQSDGPISLLVADVTAPGQLRAYASFDEEAIAKLPETTRDLSVLLGKGHLAITLDQGVHTQRYQGLVSLPPTNLSQAAVDYFSQSEQLLTQIHLSVAQHFDGQTREAEEGGMFRWRAGGLMIQQMPLSQKARETSDHEADAKAAYEEDWQRTLILAATVDDHELVDFDVTEETLLYRLFHEDGVRVYERQSLGAKCSCSRERLLKVFTQFTTKERGDMAKDGKIDVDCEFCRSHYQLALEEFEA